MTGDELLILERVRNGELSAFQEFVERYKKKVYYLARDLMGNHEDAEDMSQEVFLKAFVAMKDFRGDSKISSWLYRITVNTCIDQQRKKPSKMKVLQQEFAEGQEFDVKDPGIDPHRSAEIRLLQKQIEKAIEKLTPQERTVFVLRHYHELMLREIAEVLNKSEGTVKSLLFRALKRLQKELSIYRTNFIMRDQNG